MPGAGGASALEGAWQGTSKRLEGPLEKLDARLLAAHAARDQSVLVGLYAEAGDVAEAAGNLDAACFYLTHAYVFALDEGDARARELHARLKARGREE